jgi:hypothetical protein
LVALAPNVILATSGTTVPWLLQATRSVPIVFTQTPDPVGAGFVASLAHPGGNITGFINFEYSIGGPALGLANPQFGHRCRRGRRHPRSAAVRMIGKRGASAVVAPIRFSMR